MRTTTRLMMRLHRTAGRERGASLVEYALLVALIAMVCFVAIIYFGNATSSSLNSTGSSIGAIN